MPRKALDCTKGKCELGIDWKNSVSPNDIAHVSDYHRESTDISHPLCVSVTFQRNEIMWCFECACGGCFKPTPSFRRHAKECSSMLSEIRNAYVSKTEISTDAYHIIPISDHQEKQQNAEVIQMLCLSMVDMVNEIRQLRRDVIQRMDVQNNILSDISSQISSQNRLLKATHDMSTKSEVLNLSGKRPATKHLQK